MSRPARILTVVAIVLLFVGASLALGRVLSARGAERTVLETLITDEANGRSQAVAAAVSGCAGDGHCVARIKALLAKVSQPGARIEVLQITQGTDVSPAGSTGVARIAWTAGAHLPVVQCIVTERSGNVVSGFAVGIVAISKPIDRTGACPDAPTLKTQAQRES